MLKTILLIIGCGLLTVILMGVIGLLTILFSGLIKYLRELKQERNNKLIPLRDYEKGLFIDDDTLCVKTEYGNEAYIVWSGEYFWGGAKTKEAIGDVLILPIPDKDVQRIEKKYGKRYKRFKNEK